MSVADLVTPAYFASRLTLVLELTVFVFTVKLTALAPAGTVALAGTVAAAASVVDSATTTSAAAGPLSATVAVELAPPATLVGLTEMDSRAADFTESIAVSVTPAYFAEMVTVVVVLTACVVIVIAAFVAPAGTVTLPGRLATVVLLLESVITATPAGASPLRVTVAVDMLPPVSAAGLRATEIRVAGSTESVADLVTAPYFASIVACAVVLTAFVPITAVAVVAPLGTVTLPGVKATATLLLDRTTTAPPLGAGPLNASVALETLPPITRAGFSVSEASVAGCTVIVAVFVTPANVAEIVRDVVVSRGAVVTVNAAVVPENVMLPATEPAEGSLLDRLSVEPAGAAPSRETVPVEAVPPTTARGLSANEVRVAGCTSSVALLGAAVVSRGNSGG